MTQLRTLDSFITKVRGKTIGNEWVLESKFSGLYVRYGDRVIIESYQHEPIFYKDVLDIANVEVEEKYRRTGVFTALIKRLRNTYPGMHIYVELPNPELKTLLLRLLFVEVLHDSLFFKGDI